MKALLLASALIAAPLVAQDAQPAPPPNDPAVTQANDAAAAVANAETQPTPAPGPGQTVVFKQPPTVEQAFPPPPAKESYPWCSKTVTDGCKQRYNPK